MILLLITEVGVIDQLTLALLFVETHSASATSAAVLIGRALVKRLRIKVIVVELVGCFYDISFLVSTRR